MSGIDPSIASSTAGRNLQLWSLALVWGVCVVSGLLAMAHYDSLAGEMGPEVTDWPVASKLERCERKSTLVMCVHPCCSCSYASINELARIITLFPDDLTVHLLVTQPAGWSLERVQGQLWKAAKMVPGISLKLDENGEEARRFGALTSGHVSLFGRQGQLLFRGGITSSRGHSGESVGQDTILEYLSGNDPALAQQSKSCSVFGCPLFSPGQN